MGYYGTIRDDIAVSGEELCDLGSKLRGYTGPKKSIPLFHSSQLFKRQQHFPDHAYPCIDTPIKILDSQYVKHCKSLQSM